MLQKDININEITAADIMTRTPKKIEKDEFAVKALHQMQENNITQLVVMDGHTNSRIYSLHDLLKEGIV